MYEREQLSGFGKSIRNGGRNGRRNRRKKCGIGQRRVRNALLSVAACFFVIGMAATILSVRATRVMAAPESPEVEAAIKALPNGDQILEESLQAAQKIVEESNKANLVPVIVIDPGHGGTDGGTSFGTMVEKEINLDIAARVYGKLKEKGYQPVLARGDDTYISKEDRVTAANNAGADLYISIHQNYYEDYSAKGIETWYNGEDTTGNSKRLAALVQQEVLSDTKAADRELRGDSVYYVTKAAKMPSCLIETGFLSNREEREKLANIEYREMIADGIARGIDYYFRPKTMYLTFDDGPSPENTSKVLDILRERNIKATFFLVGENVRKYPEIAKRIAAEGHNIGVHCNNHDYKTLYSSVESYVEDFETARQIILETVGIDTKIYRFPGGSINSYNKKVAEGIIEEMNARGYVYYDWNASLEDAVKKPDREKMLENARSSTLGRSSVTFLAHDVIGETASSLNEILDRLPEYRMEPLTSEVEAVQFKRH